MNLTKRFMAAVLTAMISVGAAAQSPSADHSRLLSAARAQQPALIASLKRMVLIESGSNDKAGVMAMADYTQSQLNELGAETERIPDSTGTGDLVLGTFTGNGKLRIMLQAHMDTVYPKGILATQPYHQDGNKLYGPGIADDKGGIAVILNSLAILQKIGWKNYKTITVLFNPDEELGSPGSGRTITDTASQQDVVLSFEPSPAKAIAGDEGLLLSAAGTMTAHLIVEGRAAHAGTAPDQGRNALMELSYQLLQTENIAKPQVSDNYEDTSSSYQLLKTENGDHGISGAQLNWTQSKAGEARNQIPAYAEASGDVRIENGDAGDKLLAALKAKVAEGKHIPDTTTIVALDPGRPPYHAGAKDMVLAKMAQSIYAELDGRKLMLIPGTFGGTDAGFAQVSGKPAVMESFGLSGWGYHATNEYIEVDSIVPRLYLTTRMLMDLGRKYQQPE